ncbi:citramalate synthase [Treponema parvum]|uniref:Citramalate synthase n=1 Tax=Treponema parvum TaxID=138851 RepID=A0A975F3A0_9SPIR|nr:citramalate synthase [Treponema parvum]QTQ13593.1 citramalate synthase [Treponema parvum]
MNLPDRKIEILDSTLRDGAQGEGISFSVQDKIHIVKALDEIGIAFIEAGNPGSNPKDMEFFQAAKKLKLKNARLCAFGSTRRRDVSSAEDLNVQSLLAAETEDVVIFGKSWKFQVTEILRATPEENIKMIYETIAFLKESGRNVIYDAEHFFTGYEDDKDYAMLTLQAAVDGGASVLTLCETKGGCMLSRCSEISKVVCEKFGAKVKIGIHTHDDSGLAVANSLIAVENGVRHVQGTFLGFGERTGNANLAVIIANLQLKMGYECIPPENIALLTPIAKRIAEISNIMINPGVPYVGSSAFSHKAGMHIDAVLKNPTAYEHIAPETVGNSRVFLMSEVAGRSMIIEKIKKFDPTITKSSPVVADIIKKVKDLELEGYQFEGADGSFELLVRKTIGKYQPFFKLHYYQTNGVNPRPEDGVCACAQIKLEVEGQIEVTAGDGDGPVNALDIALRKALCRFYPAVETIRLIDYKVRVLDGRSATASRVRVLIESSDSVETWTTVGVSCDIMEASWIALVDSFEYKLIKDVEQRYKKLL